MLKFLLIDLVNQNIKIEPIYSSTINRENGLLYSSILSIFILKLLDFNSSRINSIKGIYVIWRYNNDVTEK